MFLSQRGSGAPVESAGGLVAGLLGGQRGSRVDVVPVSAQSGVGLRLVCAPPVLSVLEV
jgi:hypothetical protein